MIHIHVWSVCTIDRELMHQTYMSSRLTVRIDAVGTAQFHHLANFENFENIKVKIDYRGIGMSLIGNWSHLRHLRER